MFIKKVKIRNKDGIHCRPSSRIIQKTLDFSECSINIETDKGNTALKSILGLLSLGLQQGDEVAIKVEGGDEKKVCEELAELFTCEFDFPRR